MDDTTISRRSLLRRSAGVGLLLPLAGEGFLLSLGSGVARAATRSVPGELVEQTYITSFGYTVSFIEAMIAKEEGFWEAEGLDIDIAGGQGTSTSIQALLTDSSQYSRAGGINSIVVIANEQAPIINIATARQRSQFEVVSLPEAGITGAADLEGKKVGIVSSGGQTENLLDLMLVKAGVPLDSVERPITGVGAAAYELARQGAVDAWIAVDSDRATIERTADVELDYFNTDDAVEMPSDSFVISTELAESGSDLPVRFLAGLHSAMEWALDESNHERAVEHLMVYNPDIDPEATLLELPLTIATWTAAGEDRLLELDVELWEQGQANAQAAGLIDETVDVELLLDTSFIDTVKGR